ncbi:ankyrin repeat domain-containing protein [Streptomyces longispororuber]|nr:ankyrin repeat domain-containing protein [Streptomyces longispororuber]
MARALIPAHPDYTLENRFGGTSLIPAGEHGHADYVREVLRGTDIDVDHVNDLGWTALLEAIILGDGGTDHQRVVELLLHAGADPSLADGEGVTPLAHARDRGHDEIAALLRAAGA